MDHIVHGDKGSHVLAAAICVIVIQVVAVALRFWSRALSRGTRFWWDDWMVLAALPCSLGECAIELYYVHLGLGRHLPEVLASGITLRNINIVRFASQFTYTPGITLVKLSVLFFYARVFRDSRGFRICLWATGGLVVGWCITFVTLSVCACIPPHKQWDTDVQDHCLNSFNLFVVTAATNVFIDVVILVLPLPTLWKLHTTLRRKLILTGVFVLGYCVVIVSIVRVVTTVALDQSGHEDFTWDNVKTIILVIVEIPLAIVSVCMPSIFHLVQRGFYHGMPALFSTEDPSKAIGGDLGEHVGALGNPVDGGTKYGQRLIDLGVGESEHELVPIPKATRALETMPEDITLENTHIRKRGEV